MSAVSPTSPPPAAPELDCTQEVRFAIVMYGGVSLAIYINGIAQELLRMVRSTAAACEENGRRITLSGAKITDQDTEEEKKKKLAGTERVYRKLSYLLSDDALLKSYRKSLDLNLAGGSSNGRTTDMLDDYIELDNPELAKINTRFVVDILSGTSAGGINAIFLAKALANDQSIERLKQLWVEEGDIGVLINDNKSVMGLHLRNQDPPQSLLNSRRMYLKLLKAFDEMDKPNAGQVGFDSPYIDELDLFVTTTDIQGLTLPIRLSDMLVFERRHRNVFRFKYSKASIVGEECNDFSAANNPFLAFAARCTSSFPFAFEPMRLCDIDEVLNTFPAYRGDTAALSTADGWKRFFSPYVDPETGKQISDYETRSFGDGGYLDNKPFSYATETLSRRDAPVPVDRKLIYIEPAPEHPEEDNDSFKPDAIQNVKAAILDLPTYETIREDIERIIDRNRLISRVNRIGSGIEKDLDEAEWPRPKLKEKEWETLDLAGMVRRFGIYYLPYRRLRIAAATDELARLVARVVGLDENSAHFFAVRVFVRAWREINYPDYHRQKIAEDGLDELAKRIAETLEVDKDSAKFTAVRDLTRTWMQNNCPDYIARTTEKGAAPREQSSNTSRTANQFLLDFDFKYWLRRLTFIRAKVDELYKLDQLPPANESGDGLDSESLKCSEKAKTIIERLKRLKYHPMDYASLTAPEKQEVKKVLSYLRCELREVYKNLRIRGRALQRSRADAASAEENFAARISKIKLGQDVINYLLGLDGKDNNLDFARLDEDQCVARAKALLGERGRCLPTPPPNLPNLKSVFDDAATALKKEFHETIRDHTWARCKALLKADGPMPAAISTCKPLKIESRYTDSLREYLWRYFSRFDDYDQVRFPILYGTEVGESDVVEIIRISPEDAPSLINERAEAEKPDGRRKLAGIALYHFGAFLDKVWRVNDIMWGRLDGAERLITSLLPDPENKAVRDKLISEAHGAILIEEMPPKLRAELSGLLTAALIRANAGEPSDKAIKNVVAALTDGPVKTRLETVMRVCLENKELLAFVRDGYEVNRKLDPKPLLRSVARSTQVIGKILDDIAKQHKVENKALLWITRAGQIFWGLVEVAVPGSIANLVLFHWLKLLYVLEILLIAATFLIGGPDLKRFAWNAFGLTIAINLAVLLLRDYMRGKKAVLHTIVVALALVFLFFTVIGVSEVVHPGLREWLFSSARSLLHWLAHLFS
jgi:patatin-related protein